MQDELFADGIGEITVTGHIVRIDMVSLSTTERDADNNPKTRFRQRIVMPVDAFANSVELMQKVLKGLIDADVVKRRPEPVATNGMALTPDPAMAAPTNASPNFN